MTSVTGDSSVAELVLATDGRIEQRRLAIARRRPSAATFVYAVTAAYAALFTLGSISRHLEYQSARFDLGNMTQAVWSTAHGHFLEITTQDGLQINRLGVHADPFLALLAPLWWVWPSPLMLLVLQALAVSSGALPVFWLARKHLASERAAAHFALAYLVYPAVQFNAFTVGNGVHAASFAAPLVLWALWFLDEGRLLPFAVFALLAASTKEQMPLVVGCLGIWYAARRGRKGVGLAIFGVGLALTVIDFLVVIPHFAPHGFTPFRDRYTQVGGTPAGIVTTGLTHPLRDLHVILTTHKLVYVALLLAPFLGLWALEPWLIIGAVPDFAINLLSNHGDQTMVSYHWTAGIVPYVVAASVFGAARLRRQVDRLSLYVLAAALATAVYSPFLLGVRDVKEAFPSNPIHQTKADALRLVPAGVPVSASNQLAGYLSARRRLLVFPYVSDARWVVVDERDPTYDDVTYYRAAVARLRASAAWQTLYAARGIIVLHRRAAPA
jgi:uncharacterized membrane protein